MDSDPASLNSETAPMTTKLGTKCISAILLFIAMTTWGCVKRLEIIAVLPDGRVELVSAFHGDAVDITGGNDESGKNGSPHPSVKNGWHVETKLGDDKGKSDEDEITLVATMSLKPGASLPATYAKPNSPLELAAIQFPTDITIEKTADGTYYHFKRTYIRRLWAPFDYERKLLETDEINKLMEQKPQDMTQANRKLLAETLIAIGTEQQIELLHQAFKQSGNRVPQLAQLAALNSVRKTAAEKQFTDQVTQILINTNGAQDVDALEASLTSRFETAIKEALIDGGVGEGTTSTVLREFQTARRNFLVSKDLEDESWDIHLILPGRIVAHDGADEPEALDSPDLEEENKDDDETPMDDAAKQIAAKLKMYVDHPGFETYSWSFDSEALRDRDVVLMATSFVPNKK